MTILAAGPLAGWRWAGGWQAIFYVTGVLTLLWCAAWVLLVYESPAQHPRISFRERVYIYTLTQQSSEEVRSPIQADGSRLDTYGVKYPRHYGLLFQGEAVCTSMYVPIATH